MRVIFLGTGDAFCGAGRGNSSLLIETAGDVAASGAPPARQNRILLDCGATVPQALRRRGVMPSAIDLVLVTHLHGDHVAGLPFLDLSGRYEEPGRPPLRIVGPPGTARAIDELYARLYPEVAHRARPFALEVTEVAPGERFEREGVAIEALRARHMKEPWTALMLRISRGGKLLAATGDTGPDAPIEALADGADLLVCECTFPSPADGAPPDPKATHLSVADVRRLRPLLRARRVALTHLSAPSRAEAATLEGVTVADDGMEIAL